MASYKELLKEYRKLAKRADQRLVRLEKLAETKPSVKGFAYRNAMRDIKVYGGEKATRFNIAPPKSYKALERKINDIRQFLNAKTSTKKGIKEVETKRVKTVNEKLGTDFTLEDFTNAMDSGVYDQMKKDYGYLTAIEVMNTVQRNRDVIEQAMQDAKAKNINVTETETFKGLGVDFVVGQIISKELKKNGISFLDLK